MTVLKPMTSTKPAVAPAQQPASRQWPGLLRHKPVRALVPNTVTGLGAACGVSATYIALTGGSLETAGLCLAGSAICDAVDGGVARAMDASTKLGMYFDDLADFIAYGIAPGAMLYAFGERFGEPLVVAGAAAGATVAGAVAFRLRRFTQRDPASDTLPSHVFQGLPSTGGGPLIAGAIGMTEHFVPEDPVLASMAVGLSPAVALVMASTTPYEKFSSWIKGLLGSRKSQQAGRALLLSAGVAATWSTFGAGATMFALWGGYAAMGRYGQGSA